jgi:hypothetical protein
MKHLTRTLLMAIVVVGAAIPAILADPSFAHYVASHPWAAAYLPIATGIIRAVVKAVNERGNGTEAS